MRAAFKKAALKIQHLDNGPESHLCIATAIRSAKIFPGMTHDLGEPYIWEIQSQNHPGTANGPFSGCGFMNMNIGHFGWFPKVLLFLAKLVLINISHKHLAKIPKILKVAPGALCTLWLTASSTGHYCNERRISRSIGPNSVQWILLQIYSKWTGLPQNTNFP